MMFSAGRAFIEMDPFAKVLRGSIAARASVVSSRERSAATDEEKKEQNSISLKRVTIVIFKNSEFLHLLIESYYHQDLRASRHPLR